MGKINRSKRIMINTSVGILGQILIILIGFISRRIFIQHLGQNISGLGSTFTNILEFLNIATTEIGAVAHYKIFQCNARHDNTGLSQIYYSLRTMYRFLAIGIVVVGVILSFHVEVVIYDNPFPTSYVQTVFLLMILSDGVNYLYAHTRAFLLATESVYIYNSVYTITYIIFTGCNLVGVLLWENYYLYLAISLLQNAITGIVLSGITRRRFGFLTVKSNRSKNQAVQLLRESKTLLPRAIAKFIYNSTDNLVISKFLGLVNVNIYANYTLITGNIQKLLNHFFTALRYAVGNELSEHDRPEALGKALKLITCATFIVTSMVSVLTFALMDYFIGTLWLSSEFLVDAVVKVLLCLELYWRLMGEPLNGLINVTGRFREDRTAFCIASACNIILSIVLVQSCGLSGVIIGTLVSELTMLFYRVIKLLPTWTKRIGYLVKQMVMFGLVVIEAAIVLQLSNFISVHYGFLGVMAFSVVSVVVLLLVAVVATKPYCNILPIIKILLRRKS